ncbi:uncharacterized protein A1O5_06990 [Cladophialophora psammophila CBS 110553]|uniref:Uncharacterized protein n=1 Tax=Cladophialophora psammophila CBS 110553 TaxID=1182543 RepID=W9WP20_9EURO|nr:uncharacterized protein A1O5_06990 [Cladophialophora psammophila CBS 110553]EXJ69917.1 hypothetical protein A1O5_06990 [Cladophialophora psammophila CBS 110553]
MGSSDYSNNTVHRLCNIVTPIGNLGYGLDQDHVNKALEDCVSTCVPTAIILDSGSTDSGPNCLALGSMTTSRLNYKRDLQKILSSSHRFKVIVEICEEIVAAPENSSYDFKTIAIFAGIPKPIVSQRLAKGVITGCGPAVPPISQSDIDNCVRILGQMGPEPFVQAMEATPGFRLIIGGRAYDPAPYVAFSMFCLRSKFGNSEKLCSSEILGGFMHMGKIMECGGLCARPKSAGAMATIYQNGTFDIRPLHPQSICTTMSVAAHTLYEKSRPDLLFGPGGYLDVTQSTYEELQDGRTVRVQGDRFYTSAMQGAPYQVKLEGAQVLGYRSMYFGSLRDPILLNQIDDFLVRVKGYVRQQHGTQDSWHLAFHIYDGKHKDIASELPRAPGEIFLIGEAMAGTQALATALADTARIATIHGPYPGQKATSGNFAFGICGTKTVELGPCAEFNIYHLMDLEPGEEYAHEDSIGENVVAPTGLFRWRIQDISNINHVLNGEGTTGSPAKSIQRNSDRRTTQEERSLPTKTPGVPPGPLVLGDVASVLRSKNAGPFEITFDVMFDIEEIYRAIKDSGILSQNLIESLYHLKTEECIWCGWFDQARAFKATIPRKRNSQRKASGGFFESDVHGSQQYVPLFKVPIPEDVAEKIRKILKVDERAAL